MVHSSFHKIVSFSVNPCHSLSQKDQSLPSHRLKGKGSVDCVSLFGGVSFLRNCGAASVGEYNKILTELLILPSTFAGVFRDKICSRASFTKILANYTLEESSPVVGYDKNMI